MTAHSTLYGHPMYFDSRCWRFEDNGQPTAETWRTRACGACGRHATREGHDGCLGTLPLVRNACCGHGDTKKTYVQFAPGVSIHGRPAAYVQRLLKWPRRIIDRAARPALVAIGLGILAGDLWRDRRMA